MEESSTELAEKIKNDIKGGEEDSSYLGRLTIKIIDNIQINIKNIHIRFEDNMQREGQKFSFGITLKELSAHTCDETWNESFIDRTVDNTNKSKALFKILNISHFAFYWQTNETTFATEICDDMEDKDQIDHFMQEMYPLDDEVIDGYHYLIEPISL